MFPEEIYQYTNTQPGDWVPAKGGKAHQVQESEYYFVKYGGFDWNMEAERDLFRALNGEAEIFTTPHRKYLVTERIGEPVTNPRHVLKEVPPLLHRFHQLKNPSSPQLSPWGALIQRLDIYLPQTPHNLEKEWVLKEIKRLTPTSKALKGGTLTHGDVHLGNLRVTRGGLRLIDFEWAIGASRPEYDLACLIYGEICRAGACPKNLLDYYPEKLNPELVGLGMAYKGVSGFAFRLSRGPASDARDFASSLLEADIPWGDSLKNSLSRIPGIDASSTH